MSVSITLSDNAAQVLRSLAGFDARLTGALCETLDVQNQLTIGFAQEKKLRGPRPEKLGVVTGRLRGSFRASKARATGTTIVSVIGSNVRYAGAHEYGIDQQVQVKAHERTATITRTAGGVAEFDPRTGRIRRTRKRQVKLRGATHQVKGHQRHMKFPARSFIRSTLAERADAYGSALSTAILDTWNGRT